MLRKPKAPQISEHDLQANFFREANYFFRNDPTWQPELFYAVLHGAWIAGDAKSRRKGALISKYKEEGWKSGIPDIHYDQPRGIYNKLVIEFKRGDRRKEENGGLSNEQLAYLNAIAPYAMILIAYSSEDAMNALKYYMSLSRSFFTGKTEFILLKDL